MASNQQVKGRAVNCLRFACGVWDDLFGWKRELPRDLPGDAGVHSPSTAWRALRQLLRVYPEAVAVRDRIVQPADLVIVGPARGGPTHALVVGTTRNQLWQAVKPAVGTTGMDLDFRTSRVRRVYRICNRPSWLESD